MVAGRFLWVVGARKGRIGLVGDCSARHEAPFARGSMSVERKKVRRGRWRWALADARGLGVGLLASALACAACRAQRSPPSGSDRAEWLSQASKREGASRQRARALLGERSGPREMPEIDDLMTKAILDQKAPGGVVVVGTSKGIEFQRAYGHRALRPEREPADLDTIYDLASLTKPLVTAALVEVFADRGLLDLDDPISRHLPALTGRGKETITIRQALLHVSGLPAVNPLSDYEKGKPAALREIMSSSLRSAPGHRFKYSDLGYIVLGEMLAQIGKRPLEQLARELLFEPLGMKDTGYRPPEVARGRIAPTSYDYSRKPPLIRGEVHDPRAFRLGGVAGHAGLFSTGADLARYARMLLSGGKAGPARVLSRSAVQELTRPYFTPGGERRTPGFDVRSKYSRARSPLLSERAYGHGGYTGTALWVDPIQDVFVIFLSNRVHPFGRGAVLELERDVTTAALEALSAHQRACRPGVVVHSGIDTLAEQRFDSLAGKRVGLVTHAAAVDRDGRSALERLYEAPEVQLVALFSPEHGLAAQREGRVASSIDEERRLPVFSLYGKTTRPTPAMLSGIDTLVVDLVDVGARFYTYMSTLHEVLRAAAERDIEVLVLDRPNPIGGIAVQGPMLDPRLRDFVNHHPLPIRHGMTAGELAELIAVEEELGVRLQVVDARGWRREQTHRDTALPWRNPSPNLRSPEAALLYPAVALVEGTNVSVGRGTPRPFHLLGAPFVAAGDLLDALRAAGLPGLRLAEANFTPAAGPHHGKPCFGVSLQVTSADELDPVRTGLTIAQSLARLYPKQWKSERLVQMVGDQAVVDGLLAGQSVAALQKRWEPALQRFRRRRAAFLRYPTCRSQPAPAGGPSDADLPSDEQGLTAPPSPAPASRARRRRRTIVEDRLGLLPFNASR